MKHLIPSIVGALFSGGCAAVSHTASSITIAHVAGFFSIIAAIATVANIIHKWDK